MLLQYTLFWLPPAEVTGVFFVERYNKFKCWCWEWESISLFQVSQLVAQLFQMRIRMKNLMGVMEGGSIPALSNLEESLRAEQKVLLFTISIEK